MIAGCPKCNARYRIDPEKLGPDGARLRCSQCEAVFRVSPPVAADAAPAAAGAAPAAAESSAPVAAAPSGSEASAASSQAPPLASEPPPVPKGPVVLIADPDVESAKATANAVADWGFQPLLVHDGVEAALTIQRSLPAVVVLDAALPKMFGFQICELIKRNEQLCLIHVVLVGAIHDEERYRRAPSELYGADAYVERPQLPEALRPMLDSFLEDAGHSDAVDSGPAPAASPAADLGSASRVAPAPVAPPPAPVAPPPAPVVDSTPAVAAPAPVVDTPPVAAPPVAPVETPPVAAPPAPSVEIPPAAPAPPPAVETPAVVPPAFVPAPEVASAAPPPAPAAAPVEAEADPDVVAAERLARIVVSDIVLYNPEKFEAGIQGGNVVEVLTAELDEGRSLFEMRVAPKVRENRDFLADELVRVARSRGMS